MSGETSREPDGFATLFTTQFYPSAPHEMLSESDRLWINECLSRQKRSSKVTSSSLQRVRSAQVGERYSETVSGYRLHSRIMSDLAKHRAPARDRRSEEDIPVRPKYPTHRLPEDPVYWC